jgi:EAL domain-containing protein (putative c-di-GMP-specific phosphodiesterase class I)
VLETACREAAAWPALAVGGRGADGLDAPSVSVNVSGRQLAEPTLVEDVARALIASGLPPARLTLEITESVIMHDTERTLEVLHALKALGVRLAIDDFGTGYSSLSYLQRFPVDVLKIDKSFVDGVARGGHDAALARTIVALGEMLALRTVAEGIEHETQRAQLRLLGCELGQGYLFARPLTPDALRARLVGDGAAAAGAAAPPARPPARRRAAGGGAPRGAQRVTS